MINSAALGHGLVHDVGDGRIGVHFLSNPAIDGKPVAAELAIDPEEGDEYKVTVREGERFPIGGSEWLLEGVENVGTYEYVVRITRVGSGG